MLILLDIDGVMVMGNSWRKPEFLNDGFPAFSSKAVAALNTLLFETNAEILLTTSHKSKYSLNQWKEIFNLRGIKIENVNRLQENKANLNRKEEILNWIDSNKKVIDFIIIDDDKSLNGLPELIKNKLIQTNASVGLTMDLANEAISIVTQEKFLLVH